MKTAAFDHKYGKDLNPQQKKAVYTVDRNTLLLAVPGSGKTTVLVTRLGYMVNCLHIPACNILTMTFTTTAANEMKTRFAAAFGFRFSRDMTFCTINSLCNRIIYYVASQEGKKPFSIIDEQDSSCLLRQLYQNYNHEFATDSVIKDLKANITYIKNMNLSESEFEEKDFDVDHMREIYEEYNRILRKNRQMDFDDQLLYAYNLLKKYPVVLSYYQSHFPYICVDEAQDTSRIQHEIIRMLVGDQGHLFMVGDEDQSIYGFRGSYPMALLNFERDYDGAKIITMEENYRSTSQIIKVANEFIAKNSFRHSKTIVPTRGEGCPVDIIHVPDRESQFHNLIKVISATNKNIAVLFRNNESALPLIDLLDRKDISFIYTQSDLNFFSNRIILDFYDLLNFAYHPYNTELFMKLYYKVGLHINKQTAQYVCSKSDQTDVPVMDVLMEDPQVPNYVREYAGNLEDVLMHIKKNKPYGVLGEIWNVLEYGTYAKQHNLDTGKFQILKMLSREEKTLKNLAERLSYLRDVINAHHNNDAAVTISTIHSSKGLEYDCVYLLDIINGILPAESGEQIEDILQHEEDRRICYVGITRAKKELHVFSCKGEKSAYIDEIEEIVFGKPINNNTITQHKLSSELIVKTQQAPQKFNPTPGLTIVHKLYGQGVIQSVNGDLVSVWMRDLEKIKVFSWHKVLEGHLLDL